ncbi:type I methionyl aminopeptidase [Paenibacillus sp. J5C_2022]|uniref:type I methionyl aminopeptidase n=1 Tax=Paenibacillus sp. J5C2022 TaxID=2977129 RepID=UPI0021D1B33E|nr:type I methionyl aminopeptidase [Paenibacillus sp. J5C2022]MCU6709607.1 type I methionyl aminopeptidase [Paenibacillus sp. J5C2022]
MTIQSQADLLGLMEIGNIVAMAIEEMKKSAKAGMTTLELDDIGARYLEKYGAKSAPRKSFRFPGHACISVNRDIAHGIPGNYKLQPGDLINVDVCAEKDGYIADSGQSFQLPPFSPEVSRLCSHTRHALMAIIGTLKHGVKISEIGRMMEASAAKNGYNVIENLCSHGVGRAIHEYPNIPPTYNKHDKRKLKEGMVIAIEPFFSTGADYVIEQPDGWTLRLPSDSLAAQFEHTIIITRDQPIIVTAAS